MPPRRDDARYLLMEALYYHRWGWSYEAKRLLDEIAKAIKEKEFQEGHD